MNTKLTLSLDDIVIERAKSYAKERRISLSKMIESYLTSVVNNNVNKGENGGRNHEITPLVKSLSGVIKLDENFDEKEAYGIHIIEKYK
jgi:hypothetical protein